MIAEYLRVTVGDAVSGATQNIFHAVEGRGVSPAIVSELRDGTARTLNGIERVVKATVFAAIYPSLAEALSALRSGRPSRCALHIVIDAALPHVGADAGVLSEHALPLAVTRLRAQPVAPNRGAAISVAFRDWPPLGLSLGGPRPERANLQLALAVGLALSAFDEARTDVEPEAYIRGATLAVASRLHDFETKFLGEHAEVELDATFRRVAYHLA